MTNEKPALPDLEGNAIVKNEYEGKAEALPAFKVSGIFSDHMILQREAPVRVFGRSCHIGAAVKGSWDGEEAETAVGPDGKFVLEFSPRKASALPTEMTVESDFGRARFTDVLVGDVWLLGGQSNGEHSLGACIHLSPEVKENIRPERNIRLFRQTQAYSVVCKEAQLFPQEDIINPDWKWTRSTLQDALSFSAIGYYFADVLEEKLNVPVGVIMACPGGACLRELMPEQLAHECGYFTGANVPVAGYYNTLIHPLLGITFRGQIYYQGESEGIWKEMARNYHRDLARFVEDERRSFGFDFPFYIVQLTSYRDEGEQFFPNLNWVRARQQNALALIPDSVLIVTRDQGALPEDEEWAHSPHKEEQGKRIARMALAREYGLLPPEDVSAPQPVSVERKGNQFTVRFDFTGDGLRNGAEGPLKGFGFVDKDDALCDAEAEILTENTVKVTLPDNFEPVFLSYAMRHKAYLKDAGLTSGNGLPAAAFLWDLEN